MKTSIALTMLAVAALTACSSIPPAERNAQLLSRYSEYAGPRVSDFRYYGHFQSFQPLGRDKLFVRTGVNDAYHIRVFPCFNLEYATRVGITSSLGAVRSGFDDVIAEGERCRISEIRPVNYKQLRADLKESGEKLIG
jgi:hypothetical protein